MEFKLYPKQQRAMLSVAQEILYGGAAGGGKSYFMRVMAIVLCLDIPNLKVFFFRRLYRELYINHVYSPDGFNVMLKELLDAQDVVFNKSEGIYTFYNGAQIYLCHAQHEVDINQYLGAEIHLLLIDEATQFTEKMLRFIRTRVRLGTLQIPEKWKAVLPKIIYGTNPGGVSHKYFKKGFVQYGPNKIFTAPENDGGMTREYIPALSSDNIMMVKNDPKYASRIMGIGDPRLAMAYLKGDWDLEEGAAFSDLWTPEKHIIESINIPRTWRIDRSHDYGYSAPGATLWFAESDGTQATINDLPVVLPPRSLVCIFELYFADKDDKGLKLSPAELAVRMKVFEENRRIRQRVLPGPADSSIFDATKGTKSIHDEYVANGIRFHKADKKPGSRERGFVMFRQMLLHTKNRDPEHPWILFTRNCVNTIAQIPDLPMSPENPEDVDTNAGDHLWDTIRYRLLRTSMRAGTMSFEGY